MTWRKVMFTIIEDEKLVEMVAKFDCLYDSGSALSKEPTAKDNAWKEVAEHVKRSVKDCKKRWKNIKDTYQKRQRKRKRTGSSASNKSNHWPLADMLTFMDKADYNAATNVECDADSGEEDFSETNDEDLAAKRIIYQSTENTENTIGENSKQDLVSALELQEPPPSKRTKYNDIVLQLLEDRCKERNDIMTNIVRNNDDETDIFFKSIAMSVKKLNPELINEAKLKSLQLVFDLERRNAFFQLPQNSPSPSTSSSRHSQCKCHCKSVKCKC